MKKTIGIVTSSSLSFMTKKHECLSKYVTGETTYVHIADESDIQNTWFDEIYMCPPYTGDLLKKASLRLRDFPNACSTTVIGVVCDSQNTYLDFIKESPKIHKYSRIFGISDLGIYNWHKIYILNNPKSDPFKRILQEKYKDKLRVRIGEFQNAPDIKFGADADKFLDNTKELEKLTQDKLNQVHKKDSLVNDISIYIYGIDSILILAVLAYMRLGTSLYFFLFALVVARYLLKLGKLRQ